MLFDAQAPNAVTLQNVPHRPVIIDAPEADRSACGYQGAGIVVAEIWFAGMCIGLRVKHVETGIYFRALPAWIRNVPVMDNVIQGPWSSR